MDAGVGASRAAHAYRCAKDSGERPFQPSLDRVLPALHLPARIVSAVVLELEPNLHTVLLKRTSNSLRDAGGRHRGELFRHPYGVERSQTRAVERAPYGRAGGLRAKHDQNRFLADCVDDACAALL